MRLTGLSAVVAAVVLAISGCAGSPDPNLHGGGGGPGGATLGYSAPPNGTEVHGSGGGPGGATLSTSVPTATGQSSAGSTRPAPGR